MKMMISRKEMHENREKYLTNIYNSVKILLKDSEVYLFGSILEGKSVVASDIDILVISEVERSHRKRAEVIAEIEEKAGLPLYHPFEIHLIDNKQFYKWKEIYNLKPKKLDKFLQI